jgi:hypothetical protein
MDTDFTMFPNPTNGELSLGSVQPGQELTIVNLQGIVIYKQLVQIENQKIDLSVLAEGIYFAMISGKSEVKKLVMLSH